MIAVLQEQCETQFGGSSVNVFSRLILQAQWEREVKRKQWQSDKVKLAVSCIHFTLLQHVMQACGVFVELVVFSYCESQRSPPLEETSPSVDFLFCFVDFQRHCKAKVRQSIQS